MSTESTGPEGQNEPAAADDASLLTPAAPTRPVVALIPHCGVEPPGGLSESVALGVWAAVSAPWHPAVLVASGVLPAVENIETATPAGAREIRLVASGRRDLLPSGFLTQSADAGGTVLDAEPNRVSTVATLTEALGVGAEAPDAEAETLSRDFLALGTAWWMLNDLASAMGHVDALDRDAFSQETLRAAAAWTSGDSAAARNGLRAAFEKLTEAREKFYPVDSYAVDLCLIDPASPAGSLADGLDARTPVTFIAPGKAVENQAAHDPEALVRLREGINEGWVDIVGGAYEEVDEPLLPIESIFWQFRRGSDVYRAHLDHRNVETLARRRFGLYPMLPQLARRFGFRFAVHLGLDDGRFPVRPEAKRLWESPDHSNVEALCRPPLAADRAASALQLPWRLAATMRDDHVATLPLAHWPEPVAGWFIDLRRAASYSPVLARWVTLNDYFHLTDRPFEIFGPEPDEYVTPYLAQAVARNDPRPISARAEHARARARIDALVTTRALAEALGSAPPADDSLGSALDDVETAIETGGDVGGLDPLEPFWAGALARGVVGTATGGRPGFLVINPAGVSRRAAVLLPDAALDLRPEGPLRATQFTEDGVYAVVELPAFGFAWVPRDANYDASPAPAGKVSARERRLSNESLVAEIDAGSGGLRSILAPGEETPRLGQQIVVHGLRGSDGAPAGSTMKASSFEVEYGGPALAQAVTKGEIVGPDGARLAAFRQRFRVWTGRPVLEIDVTLESIASPLLDSLARATDPWEHAIACRWAWPDPASMLRRTALLHPALTEADRPETPDALDISTRRQRTALVFGGLAHHRRHGTRMLDTLLVAGRETARSFKLGVALDLEHPFHASTELLAPAYVVATEAGPPKTGPVGWLFLVDAKSVAVTKVEYVESTEDGRGWGLVFHMLETAGHAVRCRLRLFRAPTWARQVDFQGTVIVDLPIDDDAVLVDFTPNEVARVEVTLG